MDPNRNNRPKSNRIKSSSVPSPHVPRNPPTPNRSSTTTNIDMRNSTNTHIGGNQFNYSGGAIYYGDHIYQGSQQSQPQQPFSQTQNPHPRPKPALQWGGHPSSQRQRPALLLPPTNSSTSPGYRSPATATSMAPWPGKPPSAGDILFLLSQFTRQYNTPNSPPADSQ